VFSALGLTVATAPEGFGTGFRRLATFLVDWARLVAFALLLDADLAVLVDAAFLVLRAARFFGAATGLFVGRLPELPRLTRFFATRAAPNHERKSL
jgi:hypothetical protein